jgi:hypothetical protein
MLCEKKKDFISQSVKFSQSVLHTHLEKTMLKKAIEMKILGFISVVQVLYPMYLFILKILIRRISYTSYVCNRIRIVYFAIV